jgi:hypothetical protein
MEPLVSDFDYFLPYFQISSQQVLASMRSVGLVLDKPVFNRWLQSADFIGGLL